MRIKFDGRWSYNEIGEVVELAAKLVRDNRLYLSEEDANKQEFVSGLNLYVNFNEPIMQEEYREKIYVLTREDYENHKNETDLERKLTLSQKMKKSGISVVNKPNLSIVK